MKFTINYLSKYIEQLPSNLNLLSQDLINLGLEVESSNQGVLELAIAPNRADLMSMVGIARELALKYRTKLKYPETNPLPKLTVNSKETVNPVKIKLSAAKACPKYLGRVALAVNNQVTTPDWIKQVLTDADISLISPVVDIANYVMLELGQPLHVFDLDKISNQQIIVRQATVDEKIMLLDNNQITLSTEDLVIADSNKAIAIAGVMGGLNSAVTSETKNILIECAYFDPISIRMTVNRHKILTDSSQRFAKQIDYNLPELAMQRVSNLLQDIVGGKFADPITAVDTQYTPETTVINLNKDRINQVLGFYPPELTITEILQGLGMLVKKNHTGWDVSIPSWRPDIKIPEDLIEELARFIGYDNITKQAIALPLRFDVPEQKLSFNQELRYKNYLATRGYLEVINYSFIDYKIAEHFCVPDKLYQLQNPISNSMNVMRPSLWPGLINNLVYNQHRQQNRVKIFELGTVFQLDPKLATIEQRQKIAGLISGAVLPENWQHLNQKTDFFTLKNEVLALINLFGNLGQEILFKKINNSSLHPLQSAEIYINKTKVGEMGRLHPELSKQFAIQDEAYIFELDLALIYNPKIVKFNPISKFPAIRRDFSIIVDQEISCEQIKQEILASCGELLQEIVFFDLFTGGNLPANKKSLAFGVVLQHQDKTLVEDEINNLVTKITANLTGIGAQLRA